MYEKMYYLAALVLSIGGLLVLDHRFKLAVFNDRMAAIVYAKSSIGALPI